MVILYEEIQFICCMGRPNGVMYLGHPWLMNDSHYFQTALIYKKNDKNKTLYEQKITPTTCRPINLKRTDLAFYIEGKTNVGY